MHAGCNSYDGADLATATQSQWRLRITSRNCLKRYWERIEATPGKIVASI
jgi:hypothetical protein